MLGPTGMRGLDRLCELAELGVQVLEIRDARVVGPEHRPVGVPQPARGEVGIGGSHGQRTGGPAMTDSQLQGDRATVAPAADPPRRVSHGKIR